MRGGERRGEERGGGEGEGGTGDERTNRTLKKSPCYIPRQPKKPILHGIRDHHPCVQLVRNNFFCLVIINDNLFFGAIIFKIHIGRLTPIRGVNYKVHI